MRYHKKSHYYTDETHTCFLDTEGLDYQTELGDNYDIVTLLPHTIIAENVFHVVRDRVNPHEVMELIDKLATAALRTNGTLLHRQGKLFGKFTIVVNKVVYEYTLCRFDYHTNTPR